MSLSFLSQLPAESCILYHSYFDKSSRYFNVETEYCFALTSHIRKQFSIVTNQEIYPRHTACRNKTACQKIISYHKIGSSYLTLGIKLEMSRWGGHGVLDVRDAANLVCTGTPASATLEIRARRCSARRRWGPKIHLLPLTLT